MVKKLLLSSILLLGYSLAHAQLPPPCPSPTFPPVDLCEDVCIYCNFGGINSTTAGYTSQTPPGFCGTIENEQWLGFIAGSSTATFTATPSNCQDGNGVQIALYTDCNSNPVGCYGGCTGCAGVPASITINNMIPGTNYYLLIDGFAGDQCQFTVTVTPPQSVPPVGVPGPIQGASTICPGGTSTYSIPTVPGAGVYTWTGPPGSLFNGQPSPASLDAPDGNVVQVTFGATGGTICVTPSNSCNTGVTACFPIQVVPIPPTVLPQEVVCFEDAPYETPWGQTVGTSGTYQTTLQSWQGCDSLVKQTVIVKPPIVKNLPPKYVCAGDCITICGEEYCAAGSYNHVCTSWQGCDSTVIFSVLVLNPIADIIGNGPISCINDTIVLSSAATPSGTKLWKTLAGSIIGTGNSITVTQPGTYILTVTASLGGVSCIKADTIVIAGNLTPPPVNTVGGIIGCGGATTIISANTSVNNATFAWSGPGGFTSTLQNPVVNVQGNYIVTVTDPSNGCTKTATATVTGNTIPPTVNTVGGLLDCNITTLNINATSSAGSSSYAWSGPNSFTANIQMPSVSAPGNYIVTVTDLANNCTSTATAVVTQNLTPPGASAAGGLIGCSSPTITVTSSSGGVTPVYAWSGPNGFTANTQNASVNLAGTYTVTVTGANGCTSTAAAVVNGNTNPPGAAALGGLVSCAVQSINLTGSSDSTTVSYAWTGPGGFTAATQNPSATTPGTYTVTVTGSNNCTSTATAVVDGDFVAPDIAATGGIISCAANTTTITANSNTNGVVYSWMGPGNFSSNQQTPTVSNTGTYTVTATAPNGCTSTANASVNPDVGLPNASAAGGLLTCSVTSVTLDGGSTTPGVLVEWIGPNGFTSTLEDPTVSDPGTYTFIVTNSANGCTAQASATVNQNIAAPGASATGNTLTCTDPALSIEASSTTNNVSYAWSGPGMFSSTQQNPTVNTIGTYTVTITGANGCTSTAEAVVLADQTNPIASATTDTLTCSLTSVPLNGNANTIVSYNWSGPNLFASTLQTPSTTDPGNYTLVVTAANGCTDVVTITVNQDIAPPNISVAGNTLDCNMPTVTITGNSSTNGAVYAWNGPGMFNSTQSSPSVSLNGTYVLTVTGLNGCTSTASANVMIDTTTAVLSGIPDEVLTCTAINTTIQTNVTITGSSLQNLSWTGPGGFTSSQEDPSVSAPGPYNLVATLANGCTSELQVLVDQDIVAPDAAALGGTISCSVTTITLNGSSVTPNVSYAWSGPGAFSSSQEDPSVNADGSYVLTVTAANGCTSTATTVVNLDTNPPGGNALSSNNLDCDDLSTTLTGNSNTSGVQYAWSGPGGFTGSGVSVTASNPGTYDVLITAPNGCTSTANVVVDQDIVAPNVAAAGDTIDCISGIATLTGNSATNGVVWKWTGPLGFNSNLQNPQVSQAGTYTLVVTGVNACTSSTTAVIEENTLSPDVTLTGGGTLTCAVTSLNVSASIQTTGATGVWSGPGGFSSNLPDITVLQQGVYTYTVTAQNGCISAPTVTIDQNIQAPQGVSATGGLLDCNSPTISLVGASTTAGVNYAWTGPGGFTSNQQNPAVNTAGTYTVTVTNPVNGCTSTASAIVTLDPTVPDLDVVTQTITCSTPSVVLNTTTNTPNVSFAWTGPGGFTSTLEDPSVSVAGNYALIATASSGCTSSFAITVPEDVATPNVSAAGVTLTCTSPTGAITGNSTTPGVSYSWSGPGGYTSSQASPTINLTGTYILTVTAPNGCTSTATAQAVPDASIPQVTVAGATVTCAVPSVQITGSSSTPNVTYAWTGPGGFSSTDQNPLVNAPGSYTLVVTAANGCTNASATQVLADITGPTVQIATPDILNCTTTEVILTGSVTQPGNYNYNWSTQNGNILSGNTTQTPLVSQAGIYSLVVTNNANGCTTASNINVLVDPATPSAAVLQVRDVICHGENNGALVIENITGGTPPYLYMVDNGPLNANVLYTQLVPGVHSLYIQDANGCELETSFNVAEPDPFTIELGPDVTIELGDSIILSLDNTVNFPDRVDQITVTPNELINYLCDTCGHVYTPPYSFRYTVTVADKNGCTTTDSRLVVVQRIRNVYIPNIFNPDSPTENGLFMIYGGKEVAEIKVFRVFDRWGELVHEYFNFGPNYIPSAWDGKVNGEKANPGVFVYYAEILFKDGETVIYKGDVTLVYH